MNTISRYTRHRLPRPRRFTPGTLAADMIGAMIVFALPFALLMIG